mgnify:CR=1 FL=1
MLFFQDSTKALTQEDDFFWKKKLEQILRRAPFMHPPKLKGVGSFFTLFLIASAQHDEVEKIIKRYKKQEDKALSKISALSGEERYLLFDFLIRSLIGTKPVGEILLNVVRLKVGLNVGRLILPGKTRKEIPLFIEQDGPGIVAELKFEGNCETNRFRFDGTDKLVLGGYKSSVKNLIEIWTQL